MELSRAGISEQPFRPHGRPLTFIHYQGQTAAAEFLRTVWKSPRGFGLLQGPSLSGKSTIIHHFVASLHEDTSVAVISGGNTDARILLDRMISEFGFDLKLDSARELMNLIRVFIMQQAASHDAPLLVIDDAHELSPDALKVLNELASVEVEKNAALRIVLSSDRDISDIVSAPGMTSLAARLTGTFNMLPMDGEETARYVYNKLKAGGCKQPEKLASRSVTTEVRAASGGWPGIVDRLMALALANAKRLPLAAADIEHPDIPKATGRAGLNLKAHDSAAASQAKLFLTYKGRTLREIPLNGERIILGRSEHNDIAIPSRFISRHHALFLRDGNLTLLMDLNSTNGTFVNSRRVSNHIMVNDDVITLGHHGLKFCDPTAVDTHPLHDFDMSETVIMKNVEDMRRRMARENTRLAEIAKK